MESREFDLWILSFNSRSEVPKESKEDTIELHLNQDDVQVTLSDDEGHPLPIKDVDLQLKLPSKFKHTTFKGKLWRLVQKFKRSSDQNDSIVYTIKERVKLTDSTTGQSYDVEMNLKVQIPYSHNTLARNKGTFWWFLLTLELFFNFAFIPAHSENHSKTNNHLPVKKSNSLPFVESLKKSVLCPIMPWRCRNNSEDEESTPRKSSEVGREIFQAADVITKSPQKSKSFEDLTDIINNDSREPSPNIITRA